MTRLSITAPLKKDISQVESRVWTSLLTNSAYLPGLLTLDYSLKRSQSAYPLVVLYTDSLSQEAHEALDRRCIRKRHVPYLSPACKNDYSNDPRFADTWTKLCCFGLYEYERVVHLDSDMLIMRNMDELMTLELDSPVLAGNGNRVFAASHACVCNPLRKPHYPADWIPSNCAYTYQHMMVDEAQVTGAICTTGLQHLNGGLIVLNPTKAMYDLILTTVQSPRTAEYTFPDQELLSDIFRGRWVALPYVYNALKTLRRNGVHDIIWKDNNVRNVHYILTPKPWDIIRTKGDADSVLHSWYWEANGERIENEKKAGVVDGTQRNTPGRISRTL